MPKQQLYIIYRRYDKKIEHTPNAAGESSNM